MDRGAWWATAYVVARVGCNLATKPPPQVSLNQNQTVGNAVSFSEDSGERQFLCLFQLLQVACVQCLLALLKSSSGRLNLFHNKLSLNSFPFSFTFKDPFFFSTQIIQNSLF